MSRRSQGAARAAASASAIGESPVPAAVQERGQPVSPVLDDEPLAGWTRTWSLMKLTAGLFMVLGLSVGLAWGIRHYAMTSPRFAIAKLEVEGARRLTTEQVAELAGIGVGQNIFDVDLPKAERKLLAAPWVRSARITRELPRAMHVELTEHEARAVASIGTQLFLVTRTGEPFKPLADADPYDLPIITGISVANLARDRARELERIKLGLEVLGHYERLPLSHAFQAQEVHIDPDGSVTLVVGRQGVSLRLGRGPWLMKLRMAERVMGKVQRRGKVPGIIFLDNDAHAERVVVRMR